MGEDRGTQVTNWSTQLTEPGHTLASVEDDASLVGRIRAGDTEAWTAVYDRYGRRLYNLCLSVLHSDEAADATHDAFVVAMQQVGKLRDPGALRPWLFRIAWNEALRRSRHHDRVVPQAEAEEMIAVAPGPEDEAHRRELQELMWHATSGLPDEDRVVLELHVRQGLQGADLAAALGVSTAYARKLVQRVRSRTERSLGAMLVARAGRRECATLASLLEGWNGRFSPLLRKRVARHIDGCVTCTAREAALVNPLELLGAMPLFAAPGWIRERLASASASVGPGAANLGTAAGSRRLRRWPRRQHRRLAAGAGAAAAAAVAGLVFLPNPEPAPEAFVVTENAANTQLAVSTDGHAFVAWQTGATIFERHETGGDEWSDAQELTAGFTDPRGMVDLVAGLDGAVCAFWHGFADGSQGSYGLYQRCWSDGHWTGTALATQRGTDLSGITTRFLPAFSSDGTVHTAWEVPPDTVGYDDTELSSSGPDGFTQFVIDSNNRFHVWWWNGSSGDMNHRWSEDGGQTWSEADVVDHNFSWETAADGRGGVHVISVEGGELRHFGWTADGGWSDPLDITSDAENQLTYTGLTGLEHGGVAVAWVQDEILVVSRLDENGELAAAAPVPEASGERVVETELARAGDDLHLAWLTDDGNLVHIQLGSIG